MNIRTRPARMFPGLAVHVLCSAACLCAEEAWDGLGTLVLDETFYWRTWNLFGAP